MDFLKNLLNTATATSMAPASEATVVVVKPVHPYYPTEIEIVGFVAHDMGVVQLLSLFFAGCAVILGLTWVLTSGIAPRLKRGDKWTVLWFCLCGFIHLFFEGYFAFNHARMGSLQDLFGQLWKEYALSDSRYLTSDPFVLCMETITSVCWGPLSFLMIYYIVASHPLRYPLQAIISLGQIYGDVLYYATSMFDHYHKGLTYCRPEGYYFWGYYFLMNFFWIVIPGYLLVQSVTMTAKAFRALDRISASVQGNGSAVKPKANGHIKHA